MRRVILIHWNAGEAQEGAARLRRAGYLVTWYAEQGGVSLRALRENTPDAFVIDLSRLPSHGRAVGIWLRQQRATRHVPIVFIKGDPEKTERVRELLPDAVYSDWDRVRIALRQALGRSPRDPVVPGTMDSYTGIPLPKKLGIKEKSVVTLLGAPPGFDKSLHPLPDRARLQRKAGRMPADVVLLFAKSQADLGRRFPVAERGLAEGGKLWLVWPKQASGVSTDLTQNSVRAFGLGARFVDYKVSAIDETWSGLCFARRG